ncbi:MAG: hypothetical protein IJL91_08125 [Bacteroidales bacterium]|nr:hypothetical protein [Bacteroidales bacterium]
MEKVLKLCVILIFLGVPYFSHAQESGWDGALDRYEKACRILVDYRTRMKNGETIPVESLSSVTAELEILRKYMDRLPGKMTAMQRHRLSAISALYRSGTPMPSFERISSVKWTSAFPSAKMQESFSIVQSRQSGYPSSTIARKPVFAEKHHRFSALAEVAPVPDMSYGAMIAYSFGKKTDYGIYLKGRSNFKKEDFSYDCSSDGRTDDGYIWASGKSSISRLHLSAGGFVQALPFLSVYTGAGYGQRSLCWEDSDGRWARVSDRSFEGPVIDAGVMIRPFSEGTMQRLVIESGVGLMPKGSYLDWTVGIGWSF